MARLKAITVVGGGLAGLTLGLALRQKGIPVTVWEAGDYPRHRVCGEFICGRGLEVLDQFGLHEALLNAGALPAHNAAFFLGSASSPVRPITPPALCISRFAADAALARTFRECGGELRVNDRWAGNAAAEGVVRATGRRIQSTEAGWRWLGLKAHARNVTLTADLEVHAFRHGYVGLCRLNDNEVNVCGLFRRSVARHEPLPPWQEMLCGPAHTPLRDRLAHARFDEASFCSIAGLPLRPRRGASQDECCIGDALTMIPPVTGNGMSMAFESAAMALDPLAAWSRGEMPWDQARDTVARACDAAFARRLAWGQWLHRLTLAPALQTRLGALALRSSWVWRLLFVRTRT
jgi:2-polyprenyl-6-methoxyphenol hydroxylase-like FAD-dependent oxidoreductase